MKALSIVLLCAFCLNFAKSDEIESIGEKRKRDSGFLFLFPRTLQAGKNETVCLVTHESTFPIKILVDLRVKDKPHTTGHTLDSEHSCFKLTVPPLKIKDPQRASIHLQVQLNGTILSSHSEDPIFVYPNKNIIFVESDRPIYKPGDNVKIRILVLTYDLKPPEQYVIPNIKIYNPAGHIVDIFENIETDTGLAQIEHILTEETSLGKWKIEVDSTIKYFTVKKYTLPRFQVKLNYPKSVYISNENFSVSICASYTYGRPVKGQALVKFSYREISKEAVTKIQFMNNGCAQWVLNNKEIHFVDKHTLILTAAVTEQGTTHVETMNGKIEMTNQPYKIDFKSTRKYFQPGMPYHGKLRITNKVADLSNEVVEICYNIAIRKTWNIKKMQQCTNFTIGDQNVIHFYVLPLKEHTVEIRLNARAVAFNMSDPTKELIASSFVVQKWYSPTLNYVHIRQESDSYSKCKSAQTFSVYYTTKSMQQGENITFYYMVRSKNEIIKLRKINHHVEIYSLNYLAELENVVGKVDKYVKHGTIDKFQLKFKLDPKIMSNAQLLVYYVSKRNREIVVDVHDIYVEKCLLNDISAYWEDTLLYPSELATLKIKSTPGSICAVSSVDKANSFLIDSKPLSVNSILQPFIQERASKNSFVYKCASNTRKPSNLEVDNLYDLRRRKRNILIPELLTLNGDYDSHDVFTEAGISAITNMKLVSKICKTHIESDIGLYEPNSFKTVDYEPPDENRGISIRSFFPETWLWDLFPIRSTGDATFHKFLPHTITTWTTNVMCISPSLGPGVITGVDLTIVQPFFIDIVSPYSIKRGEVLYVQVITFNYYNYSLPISLILGDTQGIELIESNDKRRTTFCVKPNDSYTHMFRIRGTHIGKTNLTVLAEIDSSYPGQCGPETIVNKRDVVYKSIVVEAEGYITENTKTTLICGNDTVTPSNVTWHFAMPRNLVPRSESAKIILNSDLLGPAMQNLEKLLTVPTGCGEQIIATLAPNLYILRYLNVGLNVSSGTTQRAVRNIKIGYQKILDYVHNDGSFSAFGYHDQTGSMFLTAFIVRTLQQAKKHIFVDENVINRAVRWISEHQLENGCFSAVSHVFQDMGGTSQENSTAALTAYVMISMLESNIPISEVIKTNAKYCINGAQHPDKYTLALTTYAMYLLDMQKEADLQLDKLLEVATIGKNQIWWSMTNTAALNVEITSYALLSLLYKNKTSHLTTASSVVRWLISQQNSRGGFTSTQDSAVALDALSRYSMVIRDKTPNLHISIDAIEEYYNLHMHPMNRLKTKEISLAKMAKVIKLTAKGQGCILAQAVHLYNVYQLENSEAFKLAVDVKPVSTIDKCSIATISPCVSYIGPGIHSNMAVLEITMPSGYEPDRASLYELVESKQNNVKKFEELENKVAMYFTELNNEPICVPFKINENAFVENQIEATVLLYDYYKPELKISKTYTMDKCEPNYIAPIPSISLTPHEHWHKIVGKDSLVAAANNISITNTNINITNNPNITSSIDNSTNSTINNILQDNNNTVQNEVVLGNSTEENSEANPNIIDIINDLNTESSLKKKRDTNAIKKTNHENFVDMNVEMDTPDCYEHATVMKVNATMHKMQKRQLNTTETNRMNKDFVDKDVEMSMPEGMEGNWPTFAMPERPMN